MRDTKISPVQIFNKFPKFGDKPKYWVQKKSCVVVYRYAIQIPPHPSTHPPVSVHPPKQEKTVENSEYFSQPVLSTSDNPIIISFFPRVSTIRKAITILFVDAFSSQNLHSAFKHSLVMKQMLKCTLQLVYMSNFVKL